MLQKKKKTNLLDFFFQNEEFRFVFLTNADYIITITTIAIFFIFLFSSTEAVLSTINLAEQA